MKESKKDKQLANAIAKWEKEQLQAAMAAEQIDKALAVVMQYKDELTDKQLEDVLAHTREQKAEIEKFLMKARNKFADKMDDLQVEAVVEGANRSEAVKVALEDL